MATPYNITDILIYYQKDVKSVEFLVQPKLKLLFNPVFFENVELIDEVKDENKYDYWVLLMSVPFILNEFKYPQLNKKFFNINQTLKIKIANLQLDYVGEGPKLILLMSLGVLK